MKFLNIIFIFMYAYQRTIKHNQSAECDIWFFNKSYEKYNKLIKCTQGKSPYFYWRRLDYNQKLEFIMHMSKYLY